MNSLIQRFHDTRLSVRLAASIALATAIALVGTITWASRAQRDTAIRQAQDFALGVHQMTLAGLTGMMITGAAAQRSVFLDQIRQANNIRSLRVVRGDAVVRQFGAGTQSEQAASDLEVEALRTGKPVFRLSGEGAGEVMHVVMPAASSRNYLGKDCMACHMTREGEILGAVAMDISLERVNADVAAFRRTLLLAALLAAIPFALLLFLAIRRFVSRPLDQMTERLHRIAEGEVDLSQRLPVKGSNEVGRAKIAFNRVMEKAGRLVEGERLARQVFENAIEGIVVCDREARIIMVNPAFTRTTGYGADEVLGQNPRLLQSGRHDAEFYDSFWGSIREHGQWQGDIWNRRKNGEIYPEFLNISTIRDRDGQVEYYVAIFNDITKRKRDEALIEFQAFHDALTGLPNRTLFRDRVEQAIAVARRKKTHVAVMFLDLDRFKLINDTLGHDAGDQLLKEVARRLRLAVREVDTVARLGGDEFTVLLPQMAEPRNAELVASKILAATKQPYVLNGRSLSVTSSIGIALFPYDGEDADTLMKNADTAMYHIKATGRAGYSLYSEELAAQPSRRLRLENDLYRAIEERQLKVYYQPQLDVRTGRVLGVEALLRWEHPELGLVSPDEFLPLAEETGVMISVGAWVLDTACQHAAAWPAQGLGPLPVAVNLSTRQFRDENLVATVKRALERSGLEAPMLELELTESMVMGELAKSVKTMAALRELGVRLAISDFGMGIYSALAELERLPVGTVKLARAFVRDIGQEDTASIVSDLMRIARSPKLKFVAVGVETEEQLARVRDLACDHAQGHLLQRPMPAEQLVAVLSGAIPLRPTGS